MGKVNATNDSNGVSLAVSPFPLSPFPLLPTLLSFSVPLYIQFAILIRLSSPFAKVAAHWPIWAATHLATLAVPASPLSLPCSPRLALELDSFGDTHSISC